ncbi:hypothetical protein D9757_002347 [Collybiopsis confluens]|uniref:Uncharacterized protein n=1 Tax=Collybiopsis confluens TaxID=2823264 RepID=A0A8H5HXR0_9AGAR|nr:hypothetical protein D9757_002347 [Collybiopsis confluens]
MIPSRNLEKDSSAAKGNNSTMFAIPWDNFLQLVHRSHHDCFLAVFRFYSNLYLGNANTARYAIARLSRPSANGGSMLTTVAETSPLGQQEPINMIISANSDSAVLKDASTDAGLGGGLQTYFNSLGFAGECLGNHLGNDQQANLGDGNGLVNQTGVLRWDFGDVQTGTCKETVDGGNHFRYWIQNESSAIFIAASYELPASSNHDIIVNGYNFGRDYISGNITGSAIPTQTLSNSSTFSGTTSFNGFNYSTSIQYVSGLLPNTSVGINHNLTVALDGQTAVDGLVAVLTVNITASNSSSTGGGSSASTGNSGALSLSTPVLQSLAMAGLLAFYATL